MDRLGCQATRIKDGLLPGGAHPCWLPGQPVDIFWHAALSRWRFVDNLRHFGPRGGADLSPSFS
jgi:hypothetical protein